MWIGLLALALGADEVTTTGDPPWAEIVYPDMFYAEILDDAILWYRVADARPEDVLLVDDQGVELPIVRHGIGPWHGLAPDGGWVVGAAYGVRFHGWEADEVVTVASGLTPPPSVPAAYALTTWVNQEYTVYSDDVCPEPIGTDVFSGMRLEVCARGIFTFGVLAEDEPETPVLDDGVDWYTPGDWLTFETRYGYWADAGPGTTGTFWLGSMDATGRFSGWIAETVTLPTHDGFEVWHRLEELPDSPVEPNEAGCDVGGVWVLDESGPVQLPDPFGEEGEAGGGAEEAADPTDGCGCDTAPGGGLGLVGLPLLALFRRRYR